MTEILEMFTIPTMEKEFSQECPFKEPVVEGVSEEDEDVKDDDKDSVAEVQDNNGGTLGKNLEKEPDGSPGKSGTVPDPATDPYPPTKYMQKRQDTKRSSKNPKVRVTGAGRDARYPFTLAAHHLIPGNASLKGSKVYDYMVKDKEVEVAKPGGGTKKYKIAENIGYNVNGSHNGVWLPGNYAIRSTTSPTRETWSVMIGDDMDGTQPDWCLAYMVAVVKYTLREGTGGQFHDTHTSYNEKLLKYLNNVHTALVKHQAICQESSCKDDTDIAPPYRIKDRLFRLSKWLRQQLRDHPASWRLPWMTSDRFKNKILSDKKAFLDAYETADP